MAIPEEQWQCQVATCGFIYNPDKGDRKGGVAKGTAFDNLPDTWRCPLCGARRDMFRPLAGRGSVAQDGI